MREWNLHKGDPLSLILVSDARLGPTEYANDQIWELLLGGGEPAALVLQTTFGLRARAFRLFPRFSQKDTAITDPVDFHKPPNVHKLFPNFIQLTFSPFPGIDVDYEVWVPQPKTIAVRLSITNVSEKPLKLGLEMIAQLAPSEGQRMVPVEIQSTPVLLGQTGNLAPVVFFTGGPHFGPGSYPSLMQELDVAVGETRRLTCSLAALEVAEKSFEQARLTAARRWDAERTYLEMFNGSGLEILTGNPDWDAAFMLAQKNAFSLLSGPTDMLPAASFVSSRLPDQGYSLRGDGSDYPYLWNGQTALESLYIATFLLPAAPQVAAGLLENFLAVQEEDGSIDWKPGLAGQRSHLMAAPFLTRLALMIADTDPQSDFIKSVFPGLLRFYQAWLNSTNDRDQDGVPEWSHPIQTGWDDHPAYARWQTWALGVDVSTIESPGLLSMIYSDCQSLLEMALQLNKLEYIPELEKSTERLKIALEQSWDETLATYRDVDRDTNLPCTSQLFYESLGSGELKLDLRLDQPKRLVIRIQSHNDQNRKPRLKLRGRDARSRITSEQIDEECFKWNLGQGVCTTRQTYRRLDTVQVSNLEADDRVQIFSAGTNFMDLSYLLPLWAGIADEERARRMVERHFTSPASLWRPFGFADCAPLPGVEQHTPTSSETAPCQSRINLLRNYLIGTGLVRYGYRAQAAELVTRLMSAVILNLKSEACFRRYYNAETGKGFGERDVLPGFAPLGLFLETLGVRIISPTKVALAGFNPFPWPVTVKYRGLTVLRLQTSTNVIFPDGQVMTVQDPGAQVIALENSSK